MAGPSAPVARQFKDRYEDALRALIQQKAKGRPVRPTFEAHNEKVVDLMEAFRESLGDTGKKLRAASRRKPVAGRRRAA